MAKSKDLESVVGADIGKNIRAFFQDKFKPKGVNLTEFAKKLDMTQESLQKYLSGKRKPGADLLVRFAKLGCNINWLLTDRMFIGEDMDRLFKEKVHEIEAKLDDLNNAVSDLKSENYDLRKTLDKILAEDKVPVDIKLAILKDIQSKAFSNIKN